MRIIKKKHVTINYFVTREQLQMHMKRNKKKERNSYAMLSLFFLLAESFSLEVLTDSLVVKIFFCQYSIYL
jgi:hypothetical protein